MSCLNGWPLDKFQLLCPQRLIPPEVAVVASSRHVIELADAGHQSAGVLLLQGLAAGGDERLDGPAQQLLPIDAGGVDVVLDLLPGFLQQPVAL